MIWTNPQTLKVGFIKTLLCFFSCTLGMSLSMVYFMAYNWIFQIGIALLASYSISQSLNYIWRIVVLKFKFQPGGNHNHTGHLVSIAIMMSVSYLIMFAWPDIHATHQMQHTAENSIDSFPRMLITMVIGYLFALPYNVYNAAKSKTTELVRPCK